MSVTLGIVLLILAVVGCACGPDDGHTLDPEETFTAFCSNLFACPDTTEAMLEYGSQSGCEDVHRMDYEDRTPTCRNQVLALEDCLSTLTCRELEVYVEVGGSACDDERERLGQEGCMGL
jgi:hypothetical protein